MSKNILRLITSLNGINPDIKLQSNELAGRGDHILRCIYQIGSEGETFTEQQKQQIGAPLSEELVAIKSSINYTVCKYKTYLDTWFLQQRSALQFLYDDYAEFPIGKDATLANKFEEVQLMEYIYVLDDVILKFKGMIDSDTEDTTETTESTPPVPKSHHWWF